MKEKFIVLALCLLTVCQLFLCWSVYAQNAGYYIRQGTTYAGKHDSDQAIVYFTKALKIKANAARAYYRRAKVWVDQKGNCYNGISDYTMALKYATPKELKGQLFKAYYRRGNCWVKLGYYDKAIADYSKSLIVNPKYIKVYGLRASAYCKKGDYLKALVDANKGLSFNPKNSNLKRLVNQIISGKPVK